jgi:ABC-type nickel/cobalt efflux system permease component RcnA
MNRVYLPVAHSASRLSVLILILISALRASPASAHPVPRRAHDRTIVVRLGRDKVIINYRLEVDEFTVVYDDLPAFSDQIDLTRLTKPDEFYDAFTRCYASVLAGNLIAKLDGDVLTFTCTGRTHTLLDEQGKKLGHLRSDFVFQANWQLKLNLPHQFQFRETNYELEEGRIRIALESQAGIVFQNKMEPDKKLQEMPPSELKPGDNAKLRTVSATFSISQTLSDSIPITDPGHGGPRMSALDPRSTSPDAHSSEAGGLLDLLLDPNRGIWVLLILAGFFGAVHALAPGHGKTLVAAYLVGEHGTVWHALILGLVTTITHTGAVVILAGVLLILNPERLPNLELFGGLLVTGMGLWLLLRRLAGQADHFHLGVGHHHHHHHSHDHHAADHVHDEDGNVPPALSTPTLGGWWGLIALGISGGIVPCYDAIIMLIFAISAHRVWLALPLLLAFSAGLAGVLIVIGILVVQVKSFASSRMRAGRWLKSLPIVSAMLVTVLGLFLCYRSVHPSL